MIPDNALKISFFMDGNQWCAVFTDKFINLQESHAGFGVDKVDALLMLLIDAGMET